MSYSISSHPLPNDPARDAIHVPIIQVRLTTYALPGMPLHVYCSIAGEWLATDVSAASKMNAVADPLKFLPIEASPWPPSTIIWAFVLPREISLTHLWSSPDFPPEPAHTDDVVDDYDDCRSCYDE